MRPDEAAAERLSRYHNGEAAIDIYYELMIPGTVLVDKTIETLMSFDRIAITKAYLAQRASIARLVQAARRVIACNWAAPVPTPAFRELAEALEPYRETSQ